MKLTDKQNVFVAEYLIDLNATKAAIRAGYSEKNAFKIGSDLLQKSTIQAALQQRMKDREARTAITADRVLKELARIAFGDPRKVMVWGPKGVTLNDSESLTPDEAAMVAEASETTSANGGSIKLKLNDRLKALELLGKHLGMFSDKLELSGSVSRPYEGMSKEQVLAALEKAEHGKL